MPIYQLTMTNAENEISLIALADTTFKDEGVAERRHLQKLVREQLNILGEELLFIAEEFADWNGSSRRIDLLCLDTAGDFVVVELKTTEDGGHMELQALRYAAMISKMTFDQLAESHARSMNKASPHPETSKEIIRTFLRLGPDDELVVGQRTRAILVAADFSKEIVTTVIWLRKSGIDLRCVKMRPYRAPDASIIVDVQRYIPLPELEIVTPGLRSVEYGESLERPGSELRLRFWQGLLACSDRRTKLFAERTPAAGSWMSASVGRRGFGLTYVVRNHKSQAELSFVNAGADGKQKERNKAAFNAMKQQKAEIESEFGASLEWLELPDRDQCRIRYVIDGGFKSDPEQWNVVFEHLVDAMIKLEKIMPPRVQKLVF